MNRIIAALVEGTSARTRLPFSVCYGSGLEESGTPDMAWLSGKRLPMEGIIGFPSFHSFPSLPLLRHAAINTTHQCQPPSVPVPKATPTAGDDVSHLRLPGLTNMTPF